MQRSFYAALALGLFYGTAYAATQEPFDPFTGIAEGIAESMIISTDASFRDDANLFISSSIADANDHSARNGPMTISLKEFRESYGRINDCDDVEQIRLELDEEQEQDSETETIPPVLIMQGTGIDEKTVLGASASEDTQGINVISGGQ